MVNSLSEYKKQRNELIEDIARLRKEKADLQDKLDKVVDLFIRHINYKLAVSHNQWYINLRHKLDEILYSKKENEDERTN